MAKIPEVAVTVGKDKTVVMLPVSVAGKLDYAAFLYKVIDTFGTFYTNPTTNKTADYKTVHTVFGKVNGMIAKYYGFGDKNLVYAVYQYLKDNNKISSRPVKMGMLIAMPDKIRAVEDTETASSNALAKMGLA